jgi:hypothetical protein
MDQTPRHRRRDQEERIWSELITAQLDSWEPAALPVRFRPRRTAETTARRLAPLAAALVLIALLAFVVLTHLPRGLVSTVVNLGREQPGSEPSPHPPATALAPRRSDAAVRSAGAASGGQPPPDSTTSPDPAASTGAAGLPGGGGRGVPAAPVAPPPVPTVPAAPPQLPPAPSVPPLPPLPLPSLSAPPVRPVPSLPPLPTPPLP